MTNEDLDRLKRLLEGTRLLRRLVSERHDEVEALINMREVDDAKLLLREASLLAEIGEAITALVGKELNSE